MKRIAFKRTEHAARQERASLWDIVDAIAGDAAEAELAITGTATQLAATQAFEAAGSDYKSATIQRLCVVAKFDWESTAAQRKLWRTYGWTIIGEFPKRGYSQSFAEAYLREERRTKEQVTAYLRGDGQVPGYLRPLGERWREWINHANALLYQGAKLAAESEHGTLDAHAQAALLLYRRMTERHLDAEIRGFLESANPSQEGAAG